MVGGCWKRWSWWSSPACLYGRKEWRAAAELNRKSENFPSKLLLLWKKTFQSRRWAPKKKFLWWTERRSWVEVLLSLALLFHICFLKLGFRHSNLIFSSKLESRWYLQNMSKTMISFQCFAWRFYFIGKLMISLLYFWQASSIWWWSLSISWKRIWKMTKKKLKFHRCGRL